jgi:small GTP-binding protein
MTNDREIIKQLSEKTGSFVEKKNISGTVNSVIYAEEKVVGLSVISSEIDKFPEEIFLLDKLQKLVIRHSKISKIPPEIKKLKDLKVLDLSYNQISEPAPEIQELKNLEVLQLFNNKIKQINFLSSSLSKLSTLGLAKNKLNSVPESITQSSSLKRIDLSNNRIEYIPDQLLGLKSLKSFNITGNSPVNVPEHVIQKGSESLFEYLEKDKIRLWHSKMVIVGQGGVGKSCLLDSLSGLPFNPEKGSTHGMQVKSLKLKHPSEADTEMELNVWDFGGQDIYHATHQFYLTNNSFFLLVWSARLGYEAGKIYYWLDTIEALAPNSPIFIVATNTNQREADLPVKDILYKYEKAKKGKIIQFFDVDNADGKGIAELRKAIKHHSTSLRYMGAERPKTWVQAAEKIKTLNKRYIGRKELYKIFFEAGMNTSEYENPAEYLHEMGEILYYSKDELLKNTIIIKPEWVNGLIARILDSKTVDKTGGFLQLSVMNKIWSDISGEMQNKLVHLMEIFDLAYKVDDPETVCLVVEKLRHEEPNFVDPWDSMEGKREITLLYDDLNAMPAGIPTRFIARTHRFTTFTHWRNGVLLKYKQNTKSDKADNLALIIAKPDKKQILLKVRGNSPEYFSALLRDTLEDTLKPFEGLEMRLKVPCPGHNNKKCRHKFEIRHLEKRLNNIPQIKTIECPEGMEKMSISKMLYGISMKNASDPVNESILEEMDEHFKAQAALIKSENEELKKITQTHFAELRKFIELEFIKSFQVQQRMLDISCPNLFTLSAKEDLKLTEKLRFDVYHLELHLWCQHPGHQHPVGKPYTIKISREWLRKAAPYYNRMLKFLKWTIPIINPALSKFTGEQLPISDDINFANTIVRKFDAVKTTGTDIEIAEAPQYYDKRYELQLIAELLNKYDPKKQWRGLIRKITPEGYVMWLCDEHARAYDVKPKIKTQ